MGTTGIHRERGSNDLEWARQEFSCDNERVKQTVLDISKTGGALYAAIESITKADGTREVFGLVVKISWANKSEGHINFYYKPIEETEGPYYHDCPERILRLLTKPANRYAETWREACRQKRKDHAKAKKLLIPGATITITSPVRFRGEDPISKFVATENKLRFWAIRDNGTRFLCRLTILPREIKSININMENQSSKQS